MSKGNDEALKLYETMHEQVKGKQNTLLFKIARISGVILFIGIVFLMSIKQYEFYTPKFETAPESIYFVNISILWFIIVGFLGYITLGKDSFRSTLIVYQEVDKGFNKLLSEFSITSKLLESIVSIVLFRELKYVTVLSMVALLPQFIIVLLIDRPDFIVSFFLIVIYIVICSNIFYYLKFQIWIMSLIGLSKENEFNVLWILGMAFIGLSLFSPIIMGFFHPEVLFDSLFTTPLLEPYVAMKTPITILIILSVISIFHLIIINVLLMLCRVLFDRYYKPSIGVEK